MENNVTSEASALEEVYIAASALTTAQEDSEEFPSTSDARTVNNVMRHAYRVLTEQEKQQMQAIKDMGLDFWNLIDALGPTREASIAKTKVEEAVMWATKAITL